jgi:rhodanese-related sulfurtransferase
MAFAAAIAGYRMTGPWVTLWLAATLPTVELLCACALWLRPLRRAAATVLITACVGFLIALAQAWLRGLSVQCGCFGETAGGTHYPLWIARDIAILLALMASWRADTWPTAHRVPLAIQSLAVSMIGAALGLTYDAIHPRGTVWNEARYRRAMDTARPHAKSSTPKLARSPSKPIPLPTDITLEELRPLVATRSALIIDARPRVFWHLGHIPGALSLPRDDFDAAYAKLASQIEAAQGQPIVIYCEGGPCRDAEFVASGLHARKTGHIRIFRLGWVGWKSQAGHVPLK